MVDQNTQNNAPGGPRIDFIEAVKVKPFTENQVLSASPAYTRFLEEVAYYRADAPYLTVEKQAARCMRLSALLTAALYSPHRS